MKSEPRGFQYALEPLRSKCGWELQDLQQTLTRCNSEIRDQTLIVKQWEERISVASNELARQQEGSQVIYIDKQIIARAYIARQLQQLALARKLLTQLETTRDETIRSLHRLQKFADGLEEHREEEVKDYVQVLGKASIVEADDAWLRNILWRLEQ
jgi:hypothetical protein